MSILAGAGGSTDWYLLKIRRQIQIPKRIVRRGLQPSTMFTNNVQKFDDDEDLSLQPVSWTADKSRKLHSHFAIFDCKGSKQVRFTEFHRGMWGRMRRIIAIGVSMFERVSKNPGYELRKYLSGKEIPQLHRQVLGGSTKPGV